MEEPIIDQVENKIKSYLSEVVDLKTLVKNKDLEKQDMAKTFFLGIIEILDLYERTEQDVKERFVNENSEAIKIINRYQSIHKKLIKLLAGYGVSKIEFPDNRLIVGFSKVVETEPDISRQNDTIVSIIRNGYHRGSDVIREADLIVVKN